MTAAELAAVLTAAAGLVTAVAAVIHSIRTRKQVLAANAVKASLAARAARLGPPNARGEQ